jgi:hypothetical protein
MTKLGKNGFHSFCFSSDEHEKLDKNVPFSQDNRTKIHFK